MLATEAILAASRRSMNAAACLLCAGAVAHVGKQKSCPNEDGGDGLRAEVKSSLVSMCALSPCPLGRTHGGGKTGKFW